MASRQQSARVVSVLATTLLMLAGIFGYFRWMAPGGTGQEVFPLGRTGTKPEIPPELAATLNVDAEGLSQAVAVLQTTRGRIRMRFYTQDAPKTVLRIATLIHSGFYNGLIFHRVEPGFVIQGGDPSGTGAEGSGTRIPAEFNSRKHVPGTVAMARASDPDSADSQFYISLGTHPRLDGNYTVFAQVVEGQEVAEQIQVGDRMTAFTLEAPGTSL